MAQLDYSKLQGLIPAIIQDANTKNVLMLGFMNEEAYLKTVESGKVTFFSRTKGRLWTKGEESGHFLNVVSIEEDCDHDTLLIKVHPVGPTCHKAPTPVSAHPMISELNSSAICKTLYHAVTRKCPKAHIRPHCSSRE